MSAPRLTEAQLDTALRSIVPASAPAGLRAGIVAQAAATRQRRSLPSIVAAFVDVDPSVRRRALLMAAALLLILAGVSVAVVGSLLNDRRQDPFQNLSLAPPTDLPAFVRSAYDAMPALGPMTITYLDADGTKGRIYVDGSGAIRTEHFASAGATTPETYQVLKGTDVAETLMVDGVPRFHEQADSISEDPRVFVFAALGAGRGPISPGCEVAVSPGETYAYTPANGWTWVGAERVAGRPAHHVRCGSSDLWIDAATHLTLRSRGPALAAGGVPVDGQVETIEVTSIEDGQPPEALFDLTPPAGVASISGDEYDCATNPYCHPSDPPVTPPPAAVAPPADVDAVIKGAVDVTTVPAFELVLSESNGNYPDSTAKVFSDGAGRLRTEHVDEAGTAYESTMITLTGPDGTVGSQIEVDGRITWHHLRDRVGTGYPLALPPECATGWELVGTDLVNGSPADHVRCSDGATDPDYWIDRALGLVVREQGPDDPQYGTRVQEVTAFQLAEQPADLFELPPGTVVQP